MMIKAIIVRCASARYGYAATERCISRKNWKIESARPIHVSSARSNISAYHERLPVGDRLQPVETALGAPSARIAGPALKMTGQKKGFGSESICYLNT